MPRIEAMMNYIHDWELVIDELRQDPSFEEVILGSITIEGAIRDKRFTCIDQNGEMYSLTYYINSLNKTKIISYTMGCTSVS